MFVDIVDKWGKYTEGGRFRHGGKEYTIVRIEVHHESGAAWLVIADWVNMYEYDIDY